MGFSSKTAFSIAAQGERISWYGSLPDLKEIGCKSAWPVHISPFSWSIERLLTCKTGKIRPRPAGFSLRFFKSGRLPDVV
jgi:hypothetical protein